MGAHVSAVPNETNRRVTPLETRGVVAMSGVFGYEMDLSRSTEEEQKVIAGQVERYKACWDLVSEGDYYRLSDPFADGPYTAWAHVSQDKRRALVSVVTGQHPAALPFFALRIKGLDPALCYRVNGGESYPGDVLMQAGYPLPVFQGDYQSFGSCAWKRSKEREKG